MFGPSPSGTWTKDRARQSYGPLVPDARYRVAEAFTDYNGNVHPVGETWIYLTYGFLPYDDGLSLIVSLDRRQEWHIRLQDRPEEQGAVVRHLATHIVCVEAAPAPRPRPSLWRRWLDLIRPKS